MTPSDWLSTGDFLSYQGHRIFFRVAGQGAPLVLIHGFPTSSWDWHAVWEALADRYQLIAMDLLGFGASDKPVDFAYSIAAQAGVVEAVLAHLGVREAAVLAHDYGDTVAQELLARQIDGLSAWRLSRVVFLNGGLFPEAHRPRLIQHLLASPLGGLVARLTRYPRFAASMRQICAQPLAEAELRAMWEWIERGNGRAVMPRLIGYMAERKRLRSRWVGALERSPAPFALIDGTADPISGASLVRRYRELLPQAPVVELPGVGHYPQLEAPEAVVKAVLVFFSGRGAEAGVGHD